MGFAGGTLLALGCSETSVVQKSLEEAGSGNLVRWDNDAGVEINIFMPGIMELILLFVLASC